MKLFDWQYKVFMQSQAKYNIVPAGRRTGKTQGGVFGSIIAATNGDPILWVDTVNGNIDRYIERYFKPICKESGIRHRWEAQRRVFRVENGYIDMRSADRPETIEGFGYKKIFLNEAGIILNNEYLYTNSILPMLLDYEGSQLYAFGTPKGQMNKHGEPHRFYELWKNVLAEKDKADPYYFGMQLSSYSNPVLRASEIAEMEEEIRKISAEAVRQELYAEFVEQSEDLLFNADEFSYFSAEDFNAEHTVSIIGAIDVADEGTDSLSFPIAHVVGGRIFITDWYFTKDNTEITIPNCCALTMANNLSFLSVETNNHGSVFIKELYKGIRKTRIIGVNQKSNKHERIINMAHFIRTRVVFRSDYKTGSDYDKAMKEMLSYKKNGKAKHDDAPDSVALLCATIMDLFPHLF